MAESQALVKAKDLRFDFGDDRFQLAVPHFALKPHERVALIGPSGSGKTTLLHLLTGILTPRSGVVTLDGQDLSRLDEAGRRRHRLARVGMVFQEFELLPYLSARENILLPYLIAPNLPGKNEARARAEHLAARAGVAPMLSRKPGRLSQGERQRVAICRALVTRPALVLCDEPTGNLDPRTARTVVELLFEEVAEAEASLLVVTHDHGLLDRFARTVDISNFHPEGVA